MDLLGFIKSIGVFLLLLVSLVFQHFLVIASKISEHKRGLITGTMFVMFIAILFVMYQIITY
jgi:hypothetical protein